LVSSSKRYFLINNLSKEFDETGKAQSGNTIVNLNTLDNLLIKEHGIREINWMKIDVEGEELEVLKDANNIISKSKDIALSIQIHNIDQGGNRYNQIIKLLNNDNFKIKFEKIYANGERNTIVRKQQ
jgi:hypothetical protein